MFRRTSALTFLSLRNNKLGTIQSGSFSWLSNLETLSLDGNQIYAMQASIWCCSVTWFHAARYCPLAWLPVTWP